ncbi:MAG: hypothetical protein IID39_04640 [Planctomycetes bacterium]|nr:hypothetical protein [Planctomycetota bacterium]
MQYLHVRALGAAQPGTHEETVWIAPSAPAESTIAIPVMLVVSPSSLLGTP